MNLKACFVRGLYLGELIRKNRLFSGIEIINAVSIVFNTYVLCSYWNWHRSLRCMETTFSAAREGLVNSDSSKIYYVHTIEYSRNGFLSHIHYSHVKEKSTWFFLMSRPRWIVVETCAFKSIISFFRYKFFFQIVSLPLWPLICFTIT